MHRSERMRPIIAALIATALLAPSAAAQQPAAPRTRLMNDLNWMEFAEWVP